MGRAAVQRDRRGRERLDRDHGGPGIVLRKARSTGLPRTLLLGGSGAYSLPAGALGERLSRRRVRTPFGPSNPVHLCEKDGFRFLFLSRHGEAGYDRTAPYVNYRANIYAAKSLGVERILAWTGPGIIARGYRPGDLALPDDLLDFTRNRPSTFYEGKGIGFIRQFPVFCDAVRSALRAAWDGTPGRGGRDPRAVRLHAGGTYACTEGPRLETPAEIRFLASAGADMVGMTLCPEAFLARELEICYAPVAYLTNYAEGVRRMPYRRGALFEGMLGPSGEEPVRRARNAIPPLAIAAARALEGRDRDCPCAVSMERYRRGKAIGTDFRTWVSRPARGGRTG
ncbi:MAG: MTAP family purine nucleoside phosphorylase [Gemmatimonadota bacterium]